MLELHFNKPKILQLEYFSRLRRSQYSRETSLAHALLFSRLTDEQLCGVLYFSWYSFCHYGTARNATDGVLPQDRASSVVGLLEHRTTLAVSGKAPMFLFCRRAVLSCSVLLNWTAFLETKIRARLILRHLARFVKASHFARTESCSAKLEITNLRYVFDTVRILSRLSDYARPLMGKICENAKHLMKTNRVSMR